MGRLKLHKATIVEVNIIGEVEQHRALPPLQEIFQQSVCREGV